MTLVLATDTEALWYLTRGTGLVSLVLLTIVVVLGVLQVQNWSSPAWSKLVVAGLHKNASLVMVVFLALHVATSIVDGFAPITWLDAVVPFGSAYRPLWLGLGALALDLLIAVVVTSLLRSRLPHRAWRAVHWTAYACWPIALVHGLGTGTDGATPWVLLVEAACLAAVVGAVAWRLVAATSVSAARRIAAALATGGVVVLVATWTLAGPASAGWARRAGTPDDLLADPSTNAGAAAPAPAPSSLTPPFDEQLDGTLTRQAVLTGTGSTTITIDGALTGSPAGRVHVELTGPPARNGGVQLQTGQLTMGTAASPEEWSGPVTSLRGDQVTATVRDAAGRSSTVTVDIVPSATSSRVTGTASAGPTRTGG